MQKKIFLISLILAVIVAAQTANKKQSASKAKAKVETALEQKALYDSAILFNQFFSDSSGKFFFTYPVALPNEKALNELQKNFIKQKFGEEYLNMEITEIINIYKEKNKYVEAMSDVVIFPLPGIVQYSTYFYKNFEELAHGIKEATYGIYKLSDGKKIELKNIFIKNYEKKLTTAIIEEFLSVQNLQSLADYSYTQKESDFIPINVSIGEYNGLNFIYPINKIAPYVAGEQVVFLSWNSLKPYLNKKSPIYSKIKF